MSTNFQISPLFKKNRELAKKKKILRKENRKFHIVIVCLTAIVLIAVGLLGKNFSENNRISLESYTLASAVQAAENVVKKAREEANLKQQDAVDEAAIILSEADEEASKIIGSAKEGK